MPMRMALVLLLTLLFYPSFTRSTEASALFFTDRTTFDTAVGDTTLLTFDTQPSVVVSHFGSIPLGTITIDNLLTTGTEDLEMFTRNGAVAGEFCLCSSFELGLTLQTINPVLAMGMDVTPQDLATWPETAVRFAGTTYFLTQPSFLGVLFTQPTMIELLQIPNGAPSQNGIFSAPFSIDNVAIKAVPEPSSLLFLGTGLAGIFVWHFRRA